MFNGQSGGWAWYPTSNTAPTHLSLPPTPTSAQLSGQLSRDELQKRGEFLFLFFIETSISVETLLKLLISFDASKIY
jgi:hypothetical protein